MLTLKSSPKGVFVLFALFTVFAQAKVYSTSEISKFYKNKNALNEKEVSKTQKSYFEQYMETEGYFYSRLNNYLRSDRSPRDPKKDKIADSMLEVFLKVGNKLPTNLTLFRGTAFGYLGRYPEIGEIFGDKAFVSTSISAEVSRTFGFINYPLSEVEEFSSILMVYTEHGKPYTGLYIRHTEDSDESAEGEVLLKPGTTFRVIDYFDIKVKRPFGEPGFVTRRLYLAKYCFDQESCKQEPAELSRENTDDWNEFKVCMSEQKQKCEFKK